MNLLVFLHFFALIIYVFLALFIYLQNRKSLLNIYSVAILVCLGFWSFGMIFHHNPRTSLETVRLMENLSSFGWIGLFSFFFLFILLFTEQKKILRSRIFHFFNFSLPAFFIYLQWTGSLVVNFTLQSYGWNFVWTPSLWTYLFFTYCYSISLISVYLLIKYIRASSKPIPAKEAKIILMTIAATIIFSSLTEIIFPILGFYSIPNMGDVFSLIWVAGLVYVITKYKFFALTPFSAAEEIISTMSDSLLLLDSAGKIKEINFATSRLLNYEKDELRGKHISFIMPEENPKNFELLQRCETENIKHAITTFTSKEGELIPVSFSSSLMIDPEGTTRGIICIARDMIRQEEAESAVRESEQRYRSLYKKTPAMLMSMDKDLRILNVSDYWCVALGYGRREISGKKITDLMTDESKNKLQHNHLPGLIKNGFLDDAPLQLIKKNGEIIDVLL
ncbi:MAG: PAS domain S-box protein, partial [Calditrichia bacterium]